MPLKHKRLYMECLGISLHHRLCTDITSTLVNKNLSTRTTNNRLKFIWFSCFYWGYAMNERNLQEGQWEDRRQWSLGIGQRGGTFWNRLVYIYICQCWFFKGCRDYIKMVLSWQRSICETISVIFRCCFCGLFGFDPRKKIIKPTRHNSVKPTRRELDRCQIIGYAGLSGSNDTDVKFLQVTFCYRAYTWAA
jgi:hypothetical protein